MTERVMGLGRWLARSVALPLLILAGAAPAFTQGSAAPAFAQGSVEGSLELGDERVPITHVYAREGRPRPGSDEAAHIIVLMTDRPAPPEVAASRRAYYAAAGEGRIRGALLVLEPDPRFVLFAPGGGYVDTVVPDFFERLTLSGLRRENGIVSGHLQMSEAGDLDYGEAGAPERYRVDLRFSVPITPAPQPRQVLTGEAARSSPLAAAALRALHLVRTGSVDELRAAIHPDEPAWTMLSREDATAMLEATRRFLPAPDVFLQSIERIFIYEDDAIILARDRDGSTTVSLRRDGESWKFADGAIPND